MKDEKYLIFIKNNKNLLIILLLNHFKHKNQKYCQTIKWQKLWNLWKCKQLLFKICTNFQYFQIRWDLNFGTFFGGPEVANSGSLCLESSAETEVSIVLQVLNTDISEFCISEDQILTDPKIGSADHLVAKLSQLFGCVHLF